MSQQRQLAAILFTDIVGYTALMQEDEHRALAVIKHYNSSLNKVVPAHEGKVLNYYGDGSLCTFQSATEALNCAMELQKELQTDPVVPLRIGLHIGEVFFDDGKALGDGVNVASRIQSIGQANTILFSRELYEKIRNHPEFNARSLGFFDFKNVNDPVEVFALANEGLIVPDKSQMSGKLKHDQKTRKTRLRKKLAWVFLILILVIAGIFFISKYRNGQRSVVDNSIAVIPFLNMGNDIKQEYFAQGMMDEILNHLYKIGGLNVISRTSSMAYKDSKKTTREIAAELGVGNLLEGSVQKDGDRVRIIIQLINGKTDEHLWAETYDREFKDIFAIESDIAQQVAAALKIKIDAGTKSRIEYVPTENASAYNIYLQAKEKFSTDYEAWKKLLEEAIKLDPNFAPAYADLGFYWLVRGIIGGDLVAKSVKDSALPLLSKSFQLDSNLAAYHYYMAEYYLWFAWNFKAAAKEWEDFNRLNPSGLLWADNYTDFLIATGKAREALDFSRKRCLLEKQNWSNWLGLSYNYIYLNQPSIGLGLLDSVNQNLKIPFDPHVFYWKAWLYIYIGNYDKVLENLNKYFSYDSNERKSLRAQAWLAISYYKTDRNSDAQIIVANLELQSEKSPLSSPAYWTALFYSATGRADQALQWLQKAYTDHEVEMYWLNVEPLFNPVRQDARFKEIIKKMGFS